MTRYPPSAAAKPLLLCTAYRPCPRLCVLIHYRPRYLHDSRSISARAHVLGSGENLAQTNDRKSGGRTLHSLARDGS
jgi:hypothetical protein